MQRVVNFVYDVGSWQIRTNYSLIPPASVILVQSMIIVSNS